MHSLSLSFMHHTTPYHNIAIWEKEVNNRILCNQAPPVSSSRIFLLYCVETLTAEPGYEEEAEHLKISIDFLLELAEADSNVRLCFFRFFFFSNAHAF